MSAFASRDGEWVVTPIRLDGSEILRVTCRSVINATLEGRGLARFASGFWVADCRTVSEVARYVALDQLTS